MSFELDKFIHHQMYFGQSKHQHMREPLEQREKEQQNIEVFIYNTVKALAGFSCNFDDIFSWSHLLKHNETESLKI